MERDFEREYRSLKLSEVPDLWNRIEAGLSEKKVMAPALTASSTGHGKLSDKQYTDVKQEANNRSWFRWSFARWGVVAACLCLAIMLPTLFEALGMIGNRYANDSTASEDEGMYRSSADNAGKAEIAETEGADTMYHDKMADASDSVDIEAEAGEPNDAPAAENAGMTDYVGNVNTEADMADDADATGAAAQEEMAADKKMSAAAPFLLEDGQILEGVVIQIADVELSGDEMIYHAVVQQPDRDGMLADGIRIMLVCDADTEYNFAHNPRENIVLHNDESYEATLCYEGYSGQSDEENDGQFGESSESDGKAVDVEGIFTVIMIGKIN